MIATNAGAHPVLSATKPFTHLHLISLTASGELLTPALEQSSITTACHRRRAHTWPWHYSLIPL